MLRGTPSAFHLSLTFPMSTDEERAARKAKILARGVSMFNFAASSSVYRPLKHTLLVQADRLALLKGEIRTLHSNTGAPAPIPLSVLAEARASLPPPPELAAAEAPAVNNSSELTESSAPSAPNLGADGLRQRVTHAATSIDSDFAALPTAQNSAPAPVQSSATDTKPHSAASVPAPVAITALPTAPPVPAPPLNTSAVARALRASRLRSIRTARPCVVGVLVPALCGAMLASAWVWGCDGRPVLAAAVATAAAEANVMPGAVFSTLSPAALAEAAQHLLPTAGRAERSDDFRPSTADRWLLEQRYGAQYVEGAFGGSSDLGSEGADEEEEGVLDVGAVVSRTLWWRAGGPQQQQQGGGTLLALLCRSSDPATAPLSPSLFPLGLLLLLACRLGLEAAFAKAEAQLLPPTTTPQQQQQTKPAPETRAPIAAATAASPAAAAAESAEDRMLSSTLAEVLGTPARSPAQLAPPQLDARAATELAGLGGGLGGGGGGGLLGTALRVGPQAWAWAQQGGRLLSDLCTCVAAFVVTSAALEALAV